MFQSSPTHKISDPLRLRIWTSPLTLSSPSYPLSLLPRKYPLTQLRLTRRLLHFCRRLVSFQLYPRTLPLLHQLAHNFQALHLKLVSPKRLKNFLPLVPSYLTFDPFYQNLITSDFNLITLLMDVNTAVNITQITHAEQNDPVLIKIFKTVSNESSVSGK